jgi:hypothetical protein
MALCFVGSIPAIVVAVAQTDLADAATVAAPKMDIRVEILAIGCDGHISGTAEEGLASQLVGSVLAVCMAVAASGDANARTVVAFEGVVVALARSQVILVEVANVRSVVILGVVRERL